MRNPEAVQVLVNHARDERAHGGARQPFSEGASAVVEDLGEMADTIQALPLRQAEHEVLQRQIAEAFLQAALRQQGGTLEGQGTTAVGVAAQKVEVEVGLQQRCLVASVAHMVFIAVAAQQRGFRTDLFRQQEQRGTRQFVSGMDDDQPVGVAGGRRQVDPLGGGTTLGQPRQALARKRRGSAQYPRAPGRQGLAVDARQAALEVCVLGLLGKHQDFDPRVASQSVDEGTVAGRLHFAPVQPGLVFAAEVLPRLRARCAGREGRAIVSRRRLERGLEQQGDRRGNAFESRIAAVALQFDRHATAFVTPERQDQRLRSRVLDAHAAEELAVKAHAQLERETVVKLAGEGRDLQDDLALAQRQARHARNRAQPSARAEHMHVALAQQSLFGEQVQLPDGPFDRRLGCRHGAQPQRLLRFVRQVGQFLAQQRGRQQTPGRLRLQAREQPVQAAGAPVGFASGPGLALLQRQPGMPQLAHGDGRQERAYLMRAARQQLAVVFHQKHRRSPAFERGSLRVAPGPPRIEAPHVAGNAAPDGAIRSIRRWAKQAA